MNSPREASRPNSYSQLEHVVPCDLCIPMRTRSNTASHFEMTLSNQYMTATSVPQEDIPKAHYARLESFLFLAWRRL